MKKLTSITFFLLIFRLSFAQTDGISYQAVIIDNSPQEIPGVDIPSNNLPNTSLDVQFSIIDSGGTIEYQEIHTTETDPYGMINLMIGRGNAIIGQFDQIYWYDQKFLKVEIDLKTGGGLVPFSYQDLTYVPYVKHREIVATSTLDVDGDTNLNSSVTVNNASPTLLSGDLTVEGVVNFDGGLEVGGDAQLYADLTVEGETNLNNQLFVNADSELNGQVTIDYSADITSENDYRSYPLRVEGSRHGIVVKLDNPAPTRAQNYMSFMGSNDQVWGRIEGFQNVGSLNTRIIKNFLWDERPSLDDAKDMDEDDPPAAAPNAMNQYLINNYSQENMFEYMNFLDTAFSFGINLGACIVGVGIAGDCDDAISSGFSFIVEGIQWLGHIRYNTNNKGVAFESGGADYAEWLRKYDLDEELNYGDIVGVKGGEISKTFKNAESFMVISKNPMVIGAMPDDDQKHEFKPVAFLGQIPVKVIGKVAKGDYILPSGNEDGLGVAVSPNKMKALDYKRIVGVAWQHSDGASLFSLINTAVGINTNDLANEIDKMQSTINHIQEALIKLDPTFQPKFYDVSNLTSEPKPNVTTSKGLKELVSATYNPYGEKSPTEIVKEGLSSMNSEIINIESIPFMKAMLDDPTPENINKFTGYCSETIMKIKELMALESSTQN